MVAMPTRVAHAVKQGRTKNVHCGTTHQSKDGHRSSQGHKNSLAWQVPHTLTTMTTTTMTTSG
eukprot:2247573-Amphidinium_carterae.1